MKTKSDRNIKYIVSLLAFLLLSMPLLLDALKVKKTEASVLGLPEPNAIISSSKKYEESILRGIKVDPNNPLEIKFIVDTANDNEFGKNKSHTFIEYFLTALTMPVDKLWVNLSPYEGDRIAEADLSQTVLGRELLEQDYLLKLYTSSLTEPNSELGKQYWESQNNQSNFNKIWISPGEIELVGQDNFALISRAKLKVQSEEDYFAHKVNNNSFEDKSSFEKDFINVVKNEVNYGKRFSKLRQVYNAIILAQWYKKKYVNTMVANYIDEAKVSELSVVDKKIKEKIWKLYTRSFEQGVYSKKIKNKKYLSGGMHCRNMNLATSSSGVSETVNDFIGKIKLIYVNLDYIWKKKLEGESLRRQLGFIKQSKEELISKVIERAKLSKKDDSISTLNKLLHSFSIMDGLDVDRFIRTIDPEFFCMLLWGELDEEFVFTFRDLQIKYITSLNSQYRRDLVMGKQLVATEILRALVYELTKDDYDRNKLKEVVIKLDSIVDSFLSQIDKNYNHDNVAAEFKTLNLLMGQEIMKCDPNLRRVIYSDYLRSLMKNINKQLKSKKNLKNYRVLRYAYLDSIDIEGEKKWATLNLVKIKKTERFNLFDEMSNSETDVYYAESVYEDSSTRILGVLYEYVGEIYIFEDSFKRKIKKIYSVAEGDYKVYEGWTKYESTARILQLRDKLLLKMVAEMSKHKISELFLMRTVMHEIQHLQTSYMTNYESSKHDVTHITLPKHYVNRTLGELISETREVIYLLSTGQQLDTFLLTVLNYMLELSAKQPTPNEIYDMWLMRLTRKRKFSEAMTWLENYIDTPLAKRASINKRVLKDIKKFHEQLMEEFIDFRSQDNLDKMDAYAYSKTVLRDKLLQSSSVTEINEKQNYRPKSELGGVDFAELKELAVKEEDINMYMSRVDDLVGLKLDFVNVVDVDENFVVKMADN